MLPFPPCPIAHDSQSPHLLMGPPFALLTKPQIESSLTVLHFPSFPKSNSSAGPIHLPPRHILNPITSHYCTAPLIAHSGLRQLPLPGRSLPIPNLLSAVSQWGLSETSVSISTVVGIKATPWRAVPSPRPHPLPSPLCPLSSRLTAFFTLPGLRRAHSTFSPAVPFS